MILVAPIKRAGFRRKHDNCFLTGSYCDLRVWRNRHTRSGNDPRILSAILWRHSPPNGAIYGAKCGILRQRG